MKQEAFSYFTMGYLNVIAMLIFMGVFFGTIVWIYKKSNQKHFKDLSELPLKSEDN